MFNSKQFTNLLLVLSLAVFLLGAGYKIGQSQSVSGANSRNILSGQNPKNMDFSLFWDTWQQLQTKYVDQTKVDPKKMYYGAIKGMVASVDDPYTFFLTPDENKQSKDDLGGVFEGIGAQLGLQAGRITVIAPLKNSPSEKAGIRSGDFINKVDGQSTKGWVLPAAVSKIRGKKGTSVTLTIERDGRETDYKIMRDTITVDSVEVKLDEKKQDCGTICGTVAYLKLNQFGENTVDEWETKVTDIKRAWDARQIKGMILDLRDNPGGYLESSVYLAGEFLPKGSLVVRQESKVLGNKDYNIMRTGRLLDIPLAVIVNKGSASAAEILSGAIRDHKRGILVGEKTFGKGSVQEALDLASGAGLHVTVAKWILPGGTWINHIGIDPDITVTMKIPDGNTLTRQTDTQLERAIQEVIK